MLHSGLGVVCGTLLLRVEKNTMLQILSQSLFLYYESKQGAGIAHLPAVTCIIDLNFCLVFV